MVSDPKLRAWQYVGDPAFAPSLHEDRTPCLLYIAAEPLTPDDIPLAPPVDVTAEDMRDAVTGNIHWRSETFDAADAARDLNECLAARQEGGQ